ncbi:MAG: MMPL family transporter, partial [Solirubrobacteraceae bacterium]
MTRFVLRHRRLVVAFWLVVTVVGVASVGSATKALSTEYSVPGREGYQTNQAIARTFGSGGDSSPIVAVVTLPPGQNVDSPAIRSGLERVSARIERAVPRARIASYASTRDLAFVSADGRTTFLLVYPPPEPGGFGSSPGALAAMRTALDGVTVSGAPVHVTGTDALNSSTGKGSGGPG